MTVGVARACDPFLLGFDVLSPVTEDMVRAAWGVGFRWVGRYVNNLTAPEVALIHSEGLGILPYTEAMTSEPLSGSTGERYGRSIVGTASALGMPPRVDIAIDLELPATGSDCADHVNEMAGALIGASYDAALYVGSPQPLSAPELYSLRAARRHVGRRRARRCGNQQTRLLRPRADLVVAAMIRTLRPGDPPMSRRLKPPPPRARNAATPRLPAPPPAPSWPSYQGTSAYVGSSPSGRVHVFVDPSLGVPGAEGMQNATDLVLDADRIVALNDSYFGTSTGEVSVIVFALGGATDGTGGADHMGCDYQSGSAIEVCAAFGQSARVGALFEAELSECNMGGNLCGASTGEGLSRWCASLVSGNALADFATAPTWIADGMANWVDATDATDQDADSTGCAVAFLSWLLSLGVSFWAIAQSMVRIGEGGTLAQLYEAVETDAAANAWPKFVAAIGALPFGVSNDDPFGASSPQPAPPPAPPCPPPAPPTVALTLDQAVALLTDNWPS